MPNVAHVAMPYGEMGPIELEPNTRDLPVAVPLHWLIANATQDEVGRIVVGAAILFDAGAGTISQCLDTAIVWERG